MSANGVPRRRKPRSDAGVVRLTARDSELSEWIAQQGAVPFDLLGELMGGVSQSAVYQLARRWRDMGLGVTGRPVPGPTWLWLTRRAAREALGWDVGDYRPRAATAAHLRAVAAVRLWMEQSDRPPERWKGEREIRHDQGYRHEGASAGHTYDGIAEMSDGSRWGIEVEITPKGAGRTREVIGQASNQALKDQLSGLIWVCTDSALGDVQRVIEEMHADRGSAWADGRKEIFAWSINDVPLWFHGEEPA